MLVGSLSNTTVKLSVAPASLVVKGPPTIVKPAASSLVMVPIPRLSVAVAFVMALKRTLKFSLGSIAASPFTCTVIVALLLPLGIEPLPPAIAT